MIGDLLDAKIVRPAEGTAENLCLDAGYTGKEADVAGRGYIPHIRPRGEEAAEKDRNPDFKPRRWIVECSHSWFNRFRHIAVRYSKTDLSYHAFLDLAAGMITLNKVMTIYG
jgi:transposase